jgi:HAD superfamily hydrolase (TIGR01509 family)
MKIHIEAFNEIVAHATHGRAIDHYFDAVHYSHHLGMRKPNTDIYQKVIELHELNPGKTLFIDDMEPNIIGAQSVGLRTLHLTDQDYLFELFN